MAVARGLLFFLLVTLAPSLNALWLALTDKGLLEGSQLIVRGELSEEMVSAPGEPYLRILKLSHLYKGSVDVTELLFRVPSPEKLLSSIDLIYPVGKEGIWFLEETRPGSGIYFIDHPQRWWPLEREPKLLELLRGD